MTEPKPKYVTDYAYMGFVEFRRWARGWLTIHRKQKGLSKSVDFSWTS